jgi:hypothetical protein
MEAITNFFIAMLDLFEAEGRAVHRGVIRLAFRLMAVIGGAIVGLIGLGLLAWAGYEGLARLLHSHVGAAAIIGLALVGVAAAMVIYGQLSPKKPEEGVVRVLHERVPDDEIDRGSPSGKASAASKSGVANDPAYQTAN